MPAPVLSLFLGFLVSLQIAPVLAISKLSVVGSKFFDGDGNQVFFKGIAYQLTSDDPLVDSAQCKRDASLMKELGANAIRVYHVDASKDHKDCMSTFADAGIYLFVDLDDFPTQIEQDSPHWNQSQLSAFEAVLDEFQQYDNTAGVFVGNEVLTTANGSTAAPYVLAAARDVKAYRDKKNYRKIPIGYSAADIADLRPMLQNYFACGVDSVSLDFFSLNAYEWCGASSYQVSGYEELQKNATGYPIPIFLSETGCNTVKPRTFLDQTAIFGSKMMGTWSGAFIYEWIEETNDYGLVSYGPVNTDPNAQATNTAIQDGYTRQGTPTPVSPDFNNLKSVWATLTPSGVALSDYSASASSLTNPACPSSTKDAWAVDPSSSLPSLGQTFSATATSTGTSGGKATSTGASASQSSGAAQRLHIGGAENDHGVGMMVSYLLGLAGVVGWYL